jgi:pimeloyl-ACP methyl ester carboxylesterase
MYPAGIADISVRQVSLSGGLSLRVIESGPANGDRVLLVHGWAACVYTFAEMIPALTAAGYRVAALDLPGHGLSEKPIDESFYTTRSLSDTVLEAAAKIGFTRFTYVGHSMGGGIGLRLALHGERAIERLVVINAATLGTVPVLPIARLITPRLVNRVAPWVFTRTVAAAILRVAFGTSTRPTQRDIDEYWAPTQFDEFLGACRAALHRFDWQRVDAVALAAISVPMLVITGGRDLVVRPSPPSLPPSARVVHLKEGGHLVLQECADQTNAALLEFLRS